MLYRWGLSNGSSVVQTERDARRLFPEHTWIKLHLQIIFYAREFSPARGASPERDYVTMEVTGKIKSMKA
jgi:endonuclease-3